MSAAFLPEVFENKAASFFMYLLQSKACNMPNSETPMTAERIARQDRFVAEVGRRFTDGNRAMADVIARLTPPPASGACDDFTSSASMSNLTPFPWPVPGAGGFPGLAPGAGPGGWPAGVAPAPNGATPAAGPPEISGGWVWTKPGGGSTYPWGPTQLASSQLIPPWSCAAPGGGPGLAASAGSMSLDTAMSWAKWLAFALAAGLVISGTGRSGR